MRKVIIYSRPGCHLCEVAKDAIRLADCPGEYTLEEIDIETDPILLERYKNDIPVIAIDGVETFIHRVTAEGFANALRRI